ncbi:hypothetical protein EPA93_33975 [Ktedonosporobacter rubrisoli]|uniref:Uncharacterized protein n=1 Tax=Ktedonosporobacter rubrisoli TaxID=2509675 RepID=A0A4P6JYY1_KTERU|nr:hypothetical protein [Ktedonosporobacter rubrisoli]QBD80712.1 hypothetical protein EPA93_33975 [Ktedonosporobacter rubrisoli]
MNRYRVRADKRLLYRGKNGEKARKVFLEAGHKAEYVQVRTVLLLNGKIQAILGPKAGFVRPNSEET